MNEFVPDTNLLLRLPIAADPLNTLVRTVLETLQQRGGAIILLPQCLYEFYAVATRPASSRGGLGLTVAEADAAIKRYKELYRIRPDTSAIFEE